VRQLLPVLAAAAVAALGALILGEYDLVGTTAVVAGALFGAAIAEVAGALARRAFTPWLPVAVGAIAGLGMTWAVWISTNRFRNPVEASAVAGIALAAIAAAVWLSTGGRRGGNSPPVA
jgi:hypothetical protein